MKIAVLSDLHSNGDALDAVARELERRGPDRVYHLGDLVGYNAEPEKCVRWAMARTAGGILGNHDAVVCGKATGEFFHRPALLAARWSAAHVSDDSLAYLAALPVTLRVSDEILLVHGSPSDPDRYLFLLEDAEEEIDRLEGRAVPQVVFFGHTHLPAAFLRRNDGTTVSAPLEGFRVGEGERAMMNPGSVGQPRDRDPRASFQLFDTRTGEAAWVRVGYDVEACRRKILDAGLPAFFAARLADGV